MDLIVHDEASNFRERNRTNTTLCEVLSQKQLYYDQMLRMEHFLQTTKHANIPDWLVFPATKIALLTKAKFLQSQGDELTRMRATYEGKIKYRSLSPPFLCSVFCFFFFLMNNRNFKIFSTLTYSTCGTVLKRAAAIYPRRVPKNKGNSHSRRWQKGLPTFSEEQLAIKGAFHRLPDQKQKLAQVFRELSPQPLSPC